MLVDNLPSHVALIEAPERAHLAMLRTAAALASSALVLEYGELSNEEPSRVISEQPTFLIACLLLQRLDELSLLLDWYEHALEHQLASRREQLSGFPF